MTSYLSIIIFFVCLLGFISFLLFLPFIWLRKKADSQYLNVRQALGGNRYMPVFINSGGIRSLYFTGTYMGRKIRFLYSKPWNELGWLEISSKPHCVPKKFPWYTFKYSHSLIYKNYFLYSDTVSIKVKTPNLSNEKCNEILEDLNRACEMVESGNYQLN